MHPEDEKPPFACTPEYCIKVEVTDEQSLPPETEEVQIELINQAIGKAKNP